MSLRNPMGDFEITDPQAMRALAHPVRLAILNRLQRHGPGTATKLAPYVDASPSVTSWHLRHLARFGLVTEYDGGSDKRLRWWQAHAKGFRFEMPDDLEGQAAARLLRGQLLRAAVEQVAAWSRDVEPRLDSDWDKVVGIANTGVEVTREEAGEIQAQVERMLAPYVERRDGGTVPTGARAVRFLRFTLPAAVERADATAHE
ncbi:MAG: helix-turn-helix transcriptional regulator [Nocardioidaceae bacterium]|nr:helix-turn-helix transcriptional regulator [Nocardioidaceae bacterium]